MRGRCGALGGRGRYGVMGEGVDMGVLCNRGRYGVLMMHHNIDQLECVGIISEYLSQLLLILGMGFWNQDSPRLLDMRQDRTIRGQLKWGVVDMGH